MPRSLWIVGLVGSHAAQIRPAVPQHSPQSPNVPSHYGDTGPFALAEVNDPSIEALFAFYQDWNILRVRIRDPTPMLAVSPSCFGTAPGTGLLYHIHVKWNEALGIYATGPDKCGPPNTGGHYDPTLACSPDSDNPGCICVAPSSANPQAGGNYVCDPGQYQHNPWTCETGDLNGKYGFLTFNISPHTTSTPHPTTVSVETPASTAALVQPVNVMGLNVTLGDILRAAVADVSTESFGQSVPLGKLQLPAIFVPHVKPLRQSVQVSNGYDLIFRVNRDPYSNPVDQLRGRSVIVHCMNKARIACAKIQYQDNVRFEVARNEILGRIVRRVEGATEDFIADAVDDPADALRRSLEATVAKATSLVDSIANSVVEHVSSWFKVL